MNKEQAKEICNKIQEQGNVYNIEIPSASKALKYMDDPELKKIAHKQLYVASMQFFSMTEFGKFCKSVPQAIRWLFYALKSRVLSIF